MIFGVCLHKHLKILFPEGKTFYGRFGGSEILKRRPYLIILLAKNKRLLKPAFSVLQGCSVSAKCMKCLLFFFKYTSLNFQKK